MTLLALAGSGGALGASGFVVAASNRLESATAPKPQPVLHNSSLRVILFPYLTNKLKHVPLGTRVSPHTETRSGSSGHALARHRLPMWILSASSGAPRRLRLPCPLQSWD